MHSSLNYHRKSFKETRLVFTFIEMGKGRDGQKNMRIV